MKRLILVIFFSLLTLSAQTNTVTTNVPSSYTNNGYSSIFLRAGTNFTAPFSGMFLERAYSLYALESIQERTNISILETKLKTRDQLINTLSMTVTNLDFKIQNMGMILSYTTNYLTAMNSYNQTSSFFSKSAYWLIPIAFVLGSLITAGVFYIVGQVYKGITLTF